MNKKNLYTLALTIVAGIVATAQTTVLANFNFNGSASYPLAAASTASNITASVNGSQANAAYSGTVTGTNAFVANTTAGNALSMTNTNVNTWTLTLGGSGLYQFTSYKIYFQSQRSSDGATTVTLAYSTDGSTYTNASTTASPGNGSFTEATIDLSAVTGLNNQAAVYIKFSGSGATSSSGTLRIDNLEIQGTESASETSGINTTFNGAVTAPSLTVTGNTTVSGILSASTLSVTNGATFDSLDAGKSLGFGGGLSSISFSPANSSNNYTSNLIFGKVPGGGITPVSPCVLPSHSSINQFNDAIHIFSTLGSSNTLLSTGYDGVNHYMDGSGISHSSSNSRPALLLNYYCGNDVYICTGTTGGGNNINNGGVVQTGGNLEIGAPTRNTQIALNLVSSGSIAMNLANSSNQSIFSVATTGDVTMKTGRQLLIKGGDFNHGLGYNSTFDGPILYGWSGGALGTNQTSTSGGVSNVALQWDNSKNVTVPILAGSGTSMVVASSTGVLSTQPIQQLSISGNVVSLTNGGSVTLPASTDDQTLAYNSSTRVLTISNGNSVTLPASQWLSNGSNIYYPSGSNVSIGTLSTSYALNVCGTVGSSEVIVSPSGWCDYVFEDKYKRMPFEEQIKYYKENKHLKEIPTAKEIEDKGLPVSVVVKGLTLNMEETKMDMIDLYKMIQELKEQNKKLTKEVNELKKQK